LIAINSHFLCLSWLTRRLELQKVAGKMTSRRPSAAADREGYCPLRLTSVQDETRRSNASTAASALYPAAADEHTNIRRGRDRAGPGKLSTNPKAL
jgi:hypothetical protein